MAALMTTMMANMETMRISIEENDAGNNLYGRGRDPSGDRCRGRGGKYGNRNAQGRERLAQRRCRGG